MPAGHVTRNVRCVDPATGPLRPSMNPAIAPNVIAAIWPMDPAADTTINTASQDLR